MPTMHYTYHEFCQLHGGELIGDEQNNCKWLPDGARIDQWGMHDPPDDPGQLLRVKRRYVELKLAGEEKAFNKFRNDCAEQLSYRQQYGNTVPAPPHDWKQQLERGKGRIEKLQDELAALDREITPLPDEVARRGFHEQRQRESHDARQALTDLMGLRID